MKRILICLMVAAPAAAPATEHRWYTSVAASSAGPALASGYRFNEHVAMELGYRDLHGDGWEAALRFAKRVGRHVSLTARLGVYDSTELTIELADDESAYPGVGTSPHSRPPGQTRVEVDSHGGTHPSVGIGVQIEVSPRLALFSEVVAVPGLDIGSEDNVALGAGIAVSY